MIWKDGKGIEKNDKKDAVTIHINETKLKPLINQPTDYISIEDAVKMEKFYYDKYSYDGWELLNRSKTGGLGGSHFSK
jgi:hypothetical protein